MNNNIFKGPSFYEEKDHNVFWGREKETADLFYLLENSDFCVCYANSGEGKTSLINAGLLPMMRANSLFPIHVVFSEIDFSKIITNNGSADKLSIDQFIWQRIEDSVKSARVSGMYNGIYDTLNLHCTNIVNDCIEINDTIWWKLRCNELRINAYDTITPVLIFDQFEEVFTRKDINWINGFFKWLENIYNDEIVIQNDRLMSKPKNFKVLFSLRSEYVSELDYWSMNRCFIPPLKNNRYCLKPIEKGEACKIAKKLTVFPDSIKLDDILKAAKVERAGEWDDLDDNLPCISALALSLLLTAIERGNTNLTTKIENYVASGFEEDNESFLFHIMSNIYDNALEQAGIGKGSSIRETLEEALVDSHGRKRVPTLLDENIQSIPEHIINKLVQERILVKSGMNIEISHDCLRSVVERHIIERQKRLAIEVRRKEILRKAAERTKNRAIRQKHTIMSLMVLSLVSASSYIYLRLYAYSNIVSWFAGNQGYKYKAIINLLIVGGIIVVPSLCTLYLYTKKWGVRYSNNITHRLFFLLFLLSAFIYYDLVNCPVEGYISSNSDSAHVVGIIPFLFYACCQRFTWKYSLMYFLMLIPIWINAYGLFNVHKGFVAAYMFLVSLYIIWSFATCKTRIYHNDKKRIFVKTFLVVTNLLVLWITVLYQLGFNPLVVDYNNVVRNHILNRKWKTIVVERNGKYGFLTVEKNDIEPICLDSIDNFSSNPCCHFYISDTTNIGCGEFGTYTIHRIYNRDSLRVSYKFHPDYEYELYCYSVEQLKSNQNNDKTISAKVYFELKKELYGCLRNNKRIDIDRICSINALDSIHKKKTMEKLNTISNSVESLTDKDINSLYRTIYTDLCLCTLKDRIINNDINSVMELLFLFQICEFQEELSMYNFHYTINTIEDVTDNIISDKGFENNYSSTYSKMLHLLSAYDMVKHAPMVIDGLKSDAIHLQECNDSVLKDIGTLNISNFIQSILVKVNSGKSYDEALKQALQQLDGGIKKRLNKYDELQNMFAYNYLKSEVSFKQLADKVQGTLLPIINDRDKTTIYKSSMCDICREMANISMCRWYEDCEKYVDSIKQAETNMLNNHYRYTEAIVSATKNNKNEYERRKEQIDSICKKLSYKISKITIRSK